MRIVSFTVSGKCAFPFDMLRFDRAWPSTTQDAAKIEEDDCGEGVRLTGHSCTIDRWESFNYKVRDIE